MVFDVIGLGLNAMDTICVVDSFPQPQSKTRIQRVYSEPGGQVATALVTCSRLGLKTRYLGSVGSDDAGRDQLESLRAENVDVQHVHVAEGAATQWATIILVEGIGERTILWRRDPELSYPVDAVSPEIIRNSRLLHLDGCDSAAALQAARLARDAGIPIVIDIDELYGPETEELLETVDYLIAPEEFAANATGLRTPEDAARSLSRRYGSRVVGVTLGVEGAVFCAHGAILRSPAFRVHVADTTGAGDVFHGAFIYGLLQSWDLTQVIRFAHATAALKCTQVGARRGIPNLQQVQAFLELDQ